MHSCPQLLFPSPRLPMRSHAGIGEARSRLKALMDERAKLDATVMHEAGLAVQPSAMLAPTAAACHWHSLAVCAVYANLVYIYKH